VAQFEGDDLEHQELGEAVADTTDREPMSRP
jgi:hypothetical protein